MSGGEFAFTIQCPLLPFDGRQFYGQNAGQAMALCLWLVEDQLRHKKLTIVDPAGDTVELPIGRNAGALDARR